MFCSTIIPTIGRRSLARAVDSILEQSFSADDFEVIVVNDSGQPLPYMDWQESPRVRIIHTNRRNRSVARNAGAAIAKGKYLHFLDDDDWILPGAFCSLWDLANISESSAWLYGGFRLVKTNGDLVAEICPTEAGNCSVQLLSFEWIPLQATLVESVAFFSVGGFASLESLLGGFEDIHLSRQIVQHHDVSRTADVVATIRVGVESSTTNYHNMFNQNRQSREKVLSEPGAFTRLRVSAETSKQASSYWSGRIVYYYLASMLWNLRHRRPILAASRGVYSIASMAAAGRHVFSKSFWQGISKPHFNRVWQALQEVEADVYAGTEWQ
jgi:hypothetical protein